jgi:serine phosphatase RsbU (regulator of sigma subunit)
MNQKTRHDGFEDILPVEEKLKRYRLIQSDIETVQDKERIGIQSMRAKFGTAGAEIGIGFKRAYGSVMSGDSFQLFSFPDDSLLFIFSDVSGHGLGAYTTYVKMRSAAILAVRRETVRMKRDGGSVDCPAVVRDIIDTFTDIMEESVSRDFSSVIFTFVGKDDYGNFTFRFFNRGMHYPCLLRLDASGTVQCRNLNESDDTWKPSRNAPLGADFRAILENRYNECEESVIRISGGSRICFFTDGIIEAANEAVPPEEFGVERLKKILTGTFSHFPQAAVNMIYHEVYDFIIHPDRQFDDMTAVVIDLPGDSPSL